MKRAAIHIFLFSFAIAIGSEFAQANELDRYRSFEACHETQRRNFRNIEGHSNKSSLICDRSGYISNFQKLSMASSHIYSSFRIELDRIEDYEHFNDQLKKKVLATLKLQLKELEKLTSCGSQHQALDNLCNQNLEKYRQQIREKWPTLRTNMSIANPRSIDPHMLHSNTSWYDPIPRHLFSNAAKSTPLNLAERERIEKEFLARLIKEVPGVAAYKSSPGANPGLITEDSRDGILINIAMVKIREEAKKAYVNTVQAFPLLIFVDSVNESDPKSPSDATLKSALSKMKDELLREIQLVEGDPKESGRRLLAYRNLANEVLVNNPHLCQVAEVALKSASEHERSAQLKETALLIGASVFAIAACSSLVLCGASGAALGAADYSLSQYKAQAAFQAGVTRAFIGQTNNEIVQAASHEANSNTALAVSAIGAIASGATLFKEATAITSKAAINAAGMNKARREVHRVRNAEAVTTSKWTPRSPHEMAAYSKQHIAEVQTQAKRLLDRHGTAFPTVSKANLKILKQHDKEKVLDFNTLRRRYGYKGIPASILKDHQEYSSLVPKLSPDRQYVEISLNDALKLIWGLNPQRIASHIRGARSEAERGHWIAVQQLQSHVVKKLNRIDAEIMETAIRQLRSPQERVEMRLIELLADLTARGSNPLTELEFGRSISSTADFIQRMGKDGLVSKIAGGSDSPMEIHAARRLLDRVSLEEITEMATWLERK